LLANVKRATAEGGIAPGRRAELIRLASLFDASTVDDAHSLYAASFGLWSTRHFLFTPDVDETLPTTSWREGMKTPVPVSMSTRGDRSARGRASKIVENPLGEQIALAEAEELARQREAVYAELRAAATSMETITLSVGAFEVLYDMLRRATSHRERAESAGECVHSSSRLRVRVEPRVGAEFRILATHGTLTLHDVAVDVQLCDSSMSKELICG
jgi:hypothetical protein